MAQETDANLAVCPIHNEQCPTPSPAAAHDPSQERLRETGMRQRGTATLITHSLQAGAITGG